MECWSQLIDSGWKSVFSSIMVIAHWYLHLNKKFMLLERGIHNFTIILNMPLNVGICV